MPSKVKVTSGLVEPSTGTMIFLLPLRPEPKVTTDAERTEYKTLPFTKEVELEEACIKLLSTTVGFQHNSRMLPHFSLIPAIRYVREVMHWDLRTSKDFVDGVYENNAGQIDAARVEYQKTWKAKYPDHGDNNGTRKTAI